MKLSIRQCEAPNAENEVEFWLERNSEGDIRLFAQNKGDVSSRSVLLEIDTKGESRLFVFVSPSLGLKLCGNRKLDCK